MSMHRFFLPALAICLALAAQAPAGQAVDFTSVNNNFTNGAWSLGWRFTVGADPITVSSLGFYDDFKDGLTERHDVGIYTEFGKLLASTTVTTADPLTNFFRYHDITALTLDANTTYRIAAETGGENYTWNTNGFKVDPSITYRDSRYTLSNTLVFPTDTDDAIGYFGPNFNLAPQVPEPATITLIGIGIAGMAGYGWRRRKNRR
jgi:hypothetical protein